MKWVAAYLAVGLVFVLALHVMLAVMVVTDRIPVSLARKSVGRLWWSLLIWPLNIAVVVGNVVRR